MDKTFICSISDGIGRLSFNRPQQANAFGTICREDMQQAWAQIEAGVAAGSVRVVVLSGTGRFFSAGGDIGEFIEHRDNPLPLIDAIIQYLHPLLLRLARLPVPVISAVNGPLGGAGIGFALCADFVLGADNLKLRSGYCGLGLSPDVGASYFLSRRIGAARAKRILMLNRALDANQCLELGIVDELHPAEQLAGAVDALAMELAKGPTGAYARVKALCDQAADNDLQGHLHQEHVLMLQSVRSADFQEGLAAHVERRPPNFRGV